MRPKRWPTDEIRGAPKTNALAFIEPTLFSSYASDHCAAVLMALASDEDFNVFNQPDRGPIILGDLRNYPEEDNRFDIIGVIE